MSHQFKPGDLALIVGALKVQANIGKVCELVEYLVEEAISTFVDPCDGCRARNAAGSPGWIVVGDGLLSETGYRGWELVDPRHLMPLRGDFEPEQQAIKQPVGVSA